MLADIVDHVIGIDPDRDRITASLVEASTGGELATEAFETTRGGYERLVAWADRHTSRESRAWAVEGSGSYGSGACAHLGAAGEQVIEFSHPRTAATSDGAKTDALDARRAAREVLGRQDLAVPRARGRREALRALETTRRGCGCRKLRRGWSGGISVLVDESVTAGRFHDLEVSIWLVWWVGGDGWPLVE